MFVIEFKDVCTDYQRRQILDQINLQILSGEFVGLVGVNGAGKTTLFKSLLDLCEIKTGTIHLFGTQHTDSHARSQLAFLPEQFTPPYYLTGKNFLAYMAALHDSIYDLAEVETICETLDIAASFLKRPVRTYSKGMAQKLGLVACLLSGKRLLVLDEPMSGLDPKARIYFKRHLLKLKAKGTTLFFSTHLLADVEALCDRMAILHDGHLRFIGTPSDCCATFAAQHLEQAYLNCIENI